MKIQDLNSELELKEIGTENRIERNQNSGGADFRKERNPGGKGRKLPDGLP